MEEEPWIAGPFQVPKTTSLGASLRTAYGVHCSLSNERPLSPLAWPMAPFRPHCNQRAPCAPSS